MSRGWWVLAVIGLFVQGCSSDDEGSCRELRRKLDRIEAEAGELEAESFEAVERLQELQEEATDVRLDLAAENC